MECRVFAILWPLLDKTVKSVNLCNILLIFPFLRRIMWFVKCDCAIQWGKYFTKIIVSCICRVIIAASIILVSQWLAKTARKYSTLFQPINSSSSISSVKALCALGSPCCWIPVQGFFNCIDFLRVFRCFLFIRLAAQRKRFFVDSHFNVETLGCILLLYLGI